MTRSTPWGIFGRPYIDLEPWLDCSCFEALDREICRGLALVDTTWTGGTLRWMGVTAPWLEPETHRDAMHVIESLGPDEMRAFLRLGEAGADDPIAEDETGAGRAFGDETDHPFTKAQMRWLSYRHGAYFPWKVCYHLLSNDRWEDKHCGAGKSFTEEARAIFPQTVAWIERLPFSEIGRVVLFGLEAHDHAPLHRDSEPGQALGIAQSISFAPRAGKRFYLQNSPDAQPLVVDARAYWFNDMDYHGVMADPHFRYSIRVDGVFDPKFVSSLRRA